MDTKNATVSHIYVSKSCNKPISASIHKLIYSRFTVKIIHVGFNGLLLKIYSDIIFTFGVIKLFINLKALMMFIYSLGTSVQKFGVRKIFSYF